MSKNIEIEEKIKIVENRKKFERLWIFTSSKNGSRKQVSSTAAGSRSLRPSPTFLDFVHSTFSQVGEAFLDLTYFS